MSMIVLARTGAHTFPAVADCTDIDLFHIADCTDLFHSRILAITFFCFFLAFSEHGQVELLLQLTTHFPEEKKHIVEGE